MIKIPFSRTDELIKLSIRVILSGLCASALVACSNDFDDPVDEQSFSTGDLNAATYVAIGDSLTAGFADGALYQSAQIDSFPNILAQSLAKAGASGDFKQPLAADNLGGLTLQGQPLEGFKTRFVLASTPTGPAPARQNGTPTTEVGNILTGQFNNLGVPGAKTFHLTAPGYGNIQGVAIERANPYFVRFASAPDTSVIADALAQSPSFFTLWIGNNDILSYSTAGGVGEVWSPVSDEAPRSEDITPIETVFKPTYAGIVDALTAKGTNSTQGALLNLPAITSIPFFTTVPTKAIPLDQASADAANQPYAAYNQGLDLAVANMAITQEEADRRKIVFTAGQNAPVMVDDNLTDLAALIDPDLVSLRQATEDDFILLTTAGRLGALRDDNDRTSIIGVGAPLMDSEVLSDSEAALVEEHRQGYNQVIKEIADSNANLIFVDIASVLADASDADGLDFGTGTVTSQFAEGGAFSLDGIHPTAKGYAITANKVIDDLNKAFSANIPRVDPGLFTEVFFESGSN